VQPPDFEHLGGYVLTRTIIGITPILLVPFLVPRGTPHDTAIAMGAGKAVTGTESGDDDGGCEGSDADVADSRPAATRLYPRGGGAAEKSGTSMSHLDGNADVDGDSDGSIESCRTDRDPLIKNHDLI
jgi:hypothetical protein